jgi:recombination protein RecA
MLADVMAQISKLHGPAVIRRAVDALMVLPHYPTNIFTLDMGLLGGVVQSGMTMVYGWSGAGKTTVTMRVVASAQAKYPDKSAVFIDAEGTFDAQWAQTHGIDIDRLVIVQPEYGEQAVDVLDAVIRAQDTSIVVLDSLPALVPLKELNDSAEDANVALQARLIGRAVRKATQAILDERKKGHFPAVVLINQWRNKITMMGDPRALPGGNALKFFMHTHFEVLVKEVLGKDANGAEVADYNEHSFKVGKCKAGSSLKTGAWEMVRNPDNPLGPGFIDEGETVLSFARKFGLFTGGGSSWRLDSVDLKFGRISEAVQYLYENDAAMHDLKRRLISMQRERVGQRPTDWW